MSIEETYLVTYIESGDEIHYVRVPKDIFDQLSKSIDGSKEGWYNTCEVFSEYVNYSIEAKDSWYGENCFYTQTGCDDEFPFTNVKRMLHLSRY